MALFKVFRGNSTTLPGTMTDGWAYFCTDTGEFFIDYSESDGSLYRKQISSDQAKISESLIDQNTGAQIKLWHGSTEEYNAISNKDDNTIYILNDENSGDINALDIVYDNTHSGMSSNNVQDAIDVLKISLVNIPIPDVSEQIDEHNDDEEAHADIRDAIPVAVSQLENDINFATISDVEEQIAALVNSAPETLNTLDELAAALGDNENFAVTITEQIAEKQDIITGEEGQFVSFDSEGNVIATDMPDISYNDLIDTPEIPSIEGLATESYVDEAIADIPTPDVSGQIATHNSDSSAHNTLFNSKQDKSYNFVFDAPVAENVIIDNNATYTFATPIELVEDDMWYLDMVDEDNWQEIVIGKVSYDEDDVLCVSFLSNEVVLYEDKILNNGYGYQISVVVKKVSEYNVNSNYIINGLEGYGAVANGGCGAHAEGCRTVASSYGAHAEGYGTVASGYYDHAEGYETVASGGWGAHAEGYRTVASGEDSHAEGINTVAYGNFSHAEGYETVAYSDNQHVQGKYNIEDKNSNYAHIVGNGFWDINTRHESRSNAHTLDWDGNAWFSGDVYVGSTSGINKDEGSKMLATVDDITSTLGGAAKIQTGSYTGTGTYGSSNPCSLTFDFVPTLVVMVAQYYSTSNFQYFSPNFVFTYMPWLTTSYQSKRGFFDKYSGYNCAKKSSDGKTLYWYNDQGGEANEQFNLSGYKYYWIAFG